MVALFLDNSLIVNWSIAFMEENVSLEVVQASRNVGKQKEAE